MRIDIPELNRLLTPPTTALIEQWMVSNGWTPFEANPKVLVRPSPAYRKYDRYCFPPTATTLHQDYPNLLAIAIRTIADAEGITILELLQRMGLITYSITITGANQWHNCLTSP